MAKAPSINDPLPQLLADILSRIDAASATQEKTSQLLEGALMKIARLEEDVKKLGAPRSRRR